PLRPAPRTRPTRARRSRRTPCAGFRSRDAQAEDSLSQPLLQVGVQELLHRRLLHVVLLEELGAGVDALLDGLAVEVIDERLDREVAHAERVLQDERVEV